MIRAQAALKVGQHIPELFPGPGMIAPHRDEQHPVRIARLEDRDDMRVIDGRRGPGLTNEAVPERVIRRQRGREDLDRDPIT